jgi:hypothetical protein
MSRTETWTTPSLRVVHALAEAKGVEPVELDPLVNRIDLEAVDTLLANSVEGVQVVCSFDGIRVVIEDDGVSVSP